jgi:hypothetical protein
VACAHQILEVLCGPEVGVDAVPVLGPVSVITAWGVRDDWGDPDGIEARPGDVVKVVLDTLEPTATVVAEISAAASIPIGTRKPISKQLIDRTLLPVSCLPR